ncbi:MAG: serine protease [Planctomycetaceae bacterium]
MASIGTGSTPMDRDSGVRNLLAFIVSASDALRRIALIKRGLNWGTGFLVGEDLLLTNRHVLEGSSLSENQIIFDYVRDGIDLTTLPACKIRESLCESPKEELDFQLVRLTQKLGTQRGYFPLLAKLPSSKSVKVTLFGFPNDNGGQQALQFMPGEVTTFINQPKVKRVGYSAETRKGASGSPVVNLAGQVVALHHWGEKNFDNFGIPMDAIVNALPEAVKKLLDISENIVNQVARSVGGLQVAVGLQAKVDKIAVRIVPQTAMAQKAALMNRLSSLDETQFDYLLVLLDADRPTHDRCSASVGVGGPVRPRVPKLMGWFNTPGRPDVSQLLIALEMLFSE